MTPIESIPALHRAGSRGLLVREHERLEQLLSQLLAAFEANAQAECARLWSELDSSLCAHLDFEERDILPAFRGVDAAGADALLAEHAQIRRKLVELGVGVHLHLWRLEVVSSFIELLRSHARREDALLYRWAEQELPKLSPPGGSPLASGGYQPAAPHARQA